jgi:hypothetical protein
MVVFRIEPSVAVIIINELLFYQSMGFTPFYGLDDG